MRAGRGLLGWSQAVLAERAGISLPTIKRMETVGPGRSAGDTVDAVQKAMESSGVIFIPSNGEGPGVRLRKLNQGEAKQ